MLQTSRRRPSRRNIDVLLAFFRYDVCDVTLSVYPHRAGLKNMPGHGGNRTYDLWNTRPMLCQLSYAFMSVRNITYSNRLDRVAQLAEHWASIPKVVGSILTGIFFKPARCGYALRVTSQASYSPEYITPHRKYHFSDSSVPL